MKLAVVLFVLGLGSHYVNRANWGADWHSFAPFGMGGIGLAAGLVFFSYIGFDAVSTTAQEAKNPQRDLPIGIILSLFICTVLYIGIAAVLTGMVPWQSINIEAPLVRAFLDYQVGWAANIVTIGSIAGLTSVMLVMLLGQSRVLYAMAHDGLLRKSSLVIFTHASARHGREPFWRVYWRRSLAVSPQSMTSERWLTLEHFLPLSSSALLS